MSTDALRAKFEAIILDGRDRSNILVSSTLDIGADGEYFNANTRKAFEWFKKGAASVVVDLPEGMTLAEFCDDAWRPEPDHERLISRPNTVQAIEAAGGTVAE